MEKSTHANLPTHKDTKAESGKARATGSAGGAKSKKSTGTGGLGSAVTITENARRVLERRYLKKDADGNPQETVEEMFTRVSLNIAKADKEYDPDADTDVTAAAFYDMMASLEFLPNSPTLMNAGRDLQQLSACFVLPIGDSMESIFDAVKHTALIHKSGGGTGFSFSKLRPSGDIVGSTMGVSSGPISFMTVFDGATEAIKQGGTRRGANMGMLRVDHPDIMHFITCKVDNDKLNNFNISVAITEEFMEAVADGGDYHMKSPRTGEPMGSLNAREVYDKIVEMAWKNGDPGIVFIDRINRDNPTPHVGEIEATNPCGEQPLLPYESCNLGSINLSRMVTGGFDCEGAEAGESGKSAEPGAEVDWVLLEETTKKAVHFLDNVIDMNKYPIPEIAEMTKSNRKIGLGVMAFSDMLIKLAIPYNSQEAVDMAERVMGFVQEKGREATKALADKRGVFPNYKGSSFDKAGEKVRNATVTTIAPTGTISIIAGCSSGIEPLFALAFTRNVMEGTELLEVNPLFEEFASHRGFDSPELMKEIAEKGGLHDIEGVPEDVKRVFVTSHDIEPNWHIRMQAAFQKFTDNAVSKTVNFANEATEADVAEVYNLAYRLGCKGVTVYRDGSRDVQVLNKGSESKVEAAAVADAPDPAHRLKSRGEVAFGVTKKVQTGCGNMYVTVNEDPEGRPFEIFTQMGKAGGCATSQCEAIGRMASLALRGGIEPEEIVKQMRGISCHLPVGYGEGKVMSCSDAMARAMDWYLGYKRATGQAMVLGRGDMASGDLDSFTDKGSSLSFLPAGDILKRGACPDCGGAVEHADGCVVCRGCGYTECG